jgi:hypothetical protein
VALDDAALLEQANGPVDRGDRDVRIDGVGAAVQLLDVRMIVGRRQHARDDATLVGHAHALFDTELFESIHGGASVLSRGQDRGSGPSC